MSGDSYGELRFMGADLGSVQWFQLHPFEFTFDEPVTISEEVEITYAAEVDPDDPSKVIFRVVRFAVDGVELDVDMIDMTPAAGVEFTIGES